MLTSHYDHDSIRLYHARWEALLPTIPDRSVDAVIVDPPYGYGLFAWDTPIAIKPFTREVRRILKPHGFYAMFGQMPSIARWHSAAVRRHFHFCEDVSWIKRNATTSDRLMRAHEHIYIYAAGERKQFYTTGGPYEDVRLPGVLVDVVTLDAIDRYIKDLRQKLRGTSTPKIRRGTAGHRHGLDGGKFAPTIMQDRSPELANYTNVWSFLPVGQTTRNGAGALHPTEKPLAIMHRLIEMLTPAGALVVDPCMGVGSTAVACRDLGRRFIGGDRELTFVAAAGGRLTAPVFEDTAVTTADTNYGPLFDLNTTTAGGQV